MHVFAMRLREDNERASVVRSFPELYITGQLTTMTFLLQVFRMNLFRTVGEEVTNS